MNIKNILTSKYINHSKVIFQITTEEALSSLGKALEKLSLSIDFSKFSKEELEKLLSDYVDAVIIYHPEDYHQARAALLRNKTVLKKHGITDEDIEILDFT
jgi:hypothetical protein